MFARAHNGPTDMPNKIAEGAPRTFSLQPVRNVLTSCAWTRQPPPLPREPGVPAQAEMAVVPAETKRRCWW